MFEKMTYENIIEDMLGRVTSDVDKREGSVIYDALAPCAYQLAQAYFLLSNYMDLLFADTATGAYLDLKVKDFGLTRKVATYSVRKITTTVAVDIGTRWGLNEVTYTISALIADNIYSATCDQPGEIGNTYSGSLQSIDNVFGVTAVLGDIITSGEDEEADDELRARFYAQVQAISTGGNAADYKNWALEVSGVGGAKVYPLWKGPGTVKVLIVDSDLAVDETLEAAVYDHIEAVRPIGAAVTVDSPTGKPISATAIITLDGSKTYGEVVSAFTASFTAYLQSLVFHADMVSYAKIGSLLLAAPGIADYSDLKLNGGTSNIAISEDELPVAGTVTLTEVA